MTNHRILKAIEKRRQTEYVEPEEKKKEVNRTNLYLFLLALLELLHIFSPLLLELLPVLERWIEVIISWL